MPATVHFLTNTLSKWDETAADALAVTFFSDERPLRGAAGLADWRLCGQLSRLIKAGKISGRRGETLLLPPARRMTFPRLVLFGLGNSVNWSEDIYRQHVRWIRDVLARAGVRSFAIQAPGRATGLIAARRALDVWMEEADKVSSATSDISLIDTPGAHKEMAETLRKRRRPTKSPD